jgi:fatty acid desaturase
VSTATVGAGVGPGSGVAVIGAGPGLEAVPHAARSNGAGTNPTEQTRTIHQPVAAWLLQGLGYHREHHINPRIPALKLRAFVRDLNEQDGATRRMEAVYDAEAAG